MMRSINAPRSASSTATSGGGSSAGSNPALPATTAVTSTPLSAHPSPSLSVVKNCSSQRHT